MSDVSTLSVIKQTIEATALPTGLTVSGLTFLGLSLDNWVFIGTAILLASNLALTVPKVYSLLKRLYFYVQSKRR